MKNIQIIGLAILTAGLLSGCGDSDAVDGGATSSQDHSDEQEHPQTLTANLKELATLRDTVRDAFAAGDLDTAHGPLHDVGHLLEDITALIEKEELPEGKAAAAKQNIETLFDAFGEVDKTFHGQEGSTYEEVSDKIDAAIKELEGLL